MPNIHTFLLVFDLSGNYVGTQQSIDLLCPNGVTPRKITTGIYLMVDGVPTTEVQNQGENTRIFVKIWNCDNTAFELVDASYAEVINLVEYPCPACQFGIEEAEEGWQRPIEWLPIPSYTESEQVIYALNAVWDTIVNPCALLCNGTGSGYTVDWGDGTITNYAFNVKAERNYVYSALSAATEFRGYRQALVKVTPQAGATINQVSLSQRHSSYGYMYHTGWIDVHININVTNLIPFTYNSQVAHSNIENIYLKGYVPSDMYAMFIYMNALQKVNAFDTSHVTTIGSAFSNCFSIQEIPAFNFGNVTIADSAFQSTKQLKLVKATDFRKVTNASRMFGDSGITDVSNLQFRDLTNMYLFNYSSGAIIHWFDFSQCNSIAGNVDYSFYLVGTDIFPNVKLNNVTTMGNIFFSLPSRCVRKILATGGRYSHNIANQLLDATALNEYFTGLGTAAPGATLTITGNPGAGSCTTLIATTKGWTIII